MKLVRPIQWDSVGFPLKHESGAPNLVWIVSFKIVSFVVWEGSEKFYLWAQGPGPKPGPRAGAPGPVWGRIRIKEGSNKF